jgi:hypothetical protein
MKRTTSKPLALSKETLRSLAGESLKEAAGGTYTWSCSCDCSACQRAASKSCCL